LLYGCRAQTNLCIEQLSTILLSVALLQDLLSSVGWLVRHTIMDASDLIDNIIFRILPTLLVEFTNQVYHREVFQNPTSGPTSTVLKRLYKAKVRHCIRRQHFFDKRFPNIQWSAMAGKQTLGGKQNKMFIVLQ
jgi:hypothetical protein